jgi:hypothetical protein
VENGTGVRGKNPNATCNPAIPAVIVCAPVLSIKLGDYVRAMEQVTVGSLYHPNYFRRVINTMFKCRPSSVMSDDLKFKYSFTCIISV